MGTLGRIAIGARGQTSYGEEVAWGEPVAPTRRVGFVSESFNNEIASLVSEEIDPSRGISKRAQGVSNISGDLAFEQNTQGYETLYKHALGDHVTMNKVDGGVRTQILSDYVSGTTLSVENNAVFEGTPGADWGLSVVYKDSNGLLTVQAVVYSALDSGGEDITIVDPSQVLHKGAWVFQSYIGSDDFWDDVYTHYIEAARDLPIGLTWEIGRDVAFFTYGGCKVNTAENTFTAQEICTGTFSYIGKGEYVGGELVSDVTAGDTTFTLTDYVLTNSGSISAAVQTVGAGLSDITVSGAFTGDETTAYQIKISLAGATDEFDWSSDGGVTWTTGVVMTGAAQLLDQGVSITWAAITGHVLDDEWRIQTGDIIGFNFSGATVQMESENDITYTSYNAYSGVFSGVPASGVGSVEYDHSATLPVAPQSTWGTSVTEPPALNPITSFKAGIYINGTFQEVLSASWTLNNNLFADKFQLGDRYRAGLPEQQRTVEGTFNTEFDDTVLYKAYLKGARAFLEIRCIEDQNRIDSQGVQTAPTGHWIYSQKHCLFPKVYYSGTTPQIGGPEQIVHDFPFQAFVDNENTMNEMALIFVNERVSI
ncbi:MAG: phage tail tube protein [Candidatus Thorarchaeota archaeon]|nr:hypothetical protein [Thermoplasmatales archaeon]